MATQEPSLRYTAACDPDSRAEPTEPRPNIEMVWKEIVMPFRRLLTGSTRIYRPLVLAALLLMMTIPSILAAQSGASGTIRGKVSDQTGAALPGVSVTIASPSLLVGQVSGTTSADGTYTFPDLPIGAYKVT